MKTGLDVKRHHSEGTKGTEEQPPMQTRFHRVLEQPTKGANAQTVPKGRNAEEDPVPHRSELSCSVHLEDLPAELVGKANDLGPFFPVSDRNEEHDTGEEHNDNVGELQEQVFQGQQVEVDQVKEKGVGEEQRNCQMYEPR